MTGASSTPVPDAVLPAHPADVQSAISIPLANLSDHRKGRP